MANGCRLMTTEGCHRLPPTAIGRLAPAPRWGSEIDTRGLVEKRLVEKLSLPSVLIVIQGGKGTFATVLQHFKNHSPVVLVRESRGCARALSDFVQV